MEAEIFNTQRLNGDRHGSTLVGWMDVVWVAFLVGLALLPPIWEIHKQLTLLTIGLLQLLEGRLLVWLPSYGRICIIGSKILLATLLLVYTGDFAINSSYYPIYYLPVVTAATYFGPLGTIFWTIVTSLVYCSLLIPALQVTQLTSSGVAELAIRSFFFFLAAILVNRFVMQLHKAQDEAQRSERLAALGQLSAGLAHEIRNPLGVIKGSAEMLHQKLHADDLLAMELSQNISSEVSRLNGLIGRFLDFARPTSLDLQSSDVVSLLERALESVQIRYPDARMTINRDFSKLLPAIRLDEGLCLQAFSNLIQNAYEAMEGQEGQLHLAVLRTSREGQEGIVIDFQDNGPGIPENQRERIFNPFMTLKKSGVGLGLSIVAKTIADHHGTIRLMKDSEPGAHFQIFLPSSPYGEARPTRKEVA